MKRSYSTPHSVRTSNVRSSSKRTRTSRSSGKKSRFGPTGPVFYQGFGFPPKLSIKHRYQESNVASAVAGSVQNQQFRCNGMYDPNSTGTGHQPLYFDQVGAIYDHFTVLKSYLKLTVSTTATDPQFVVCYINDDTSIPYSSINTPMELPSAKYTTVSAGSGPQTLYISWDAYKTFGGSVLGNDNLQGSTSADPAEQSIYTILFQAVDITKATNVIYNAEIVYYSVWDEVKDIASS